jgi:hypothetical protein
MNTIRTGISTRKKIHASSSFHHTPTPNIFRRDYRLLWLSKEFAVLHDTMMGNDELEICRNKRSWSILRHDPNPLMEGQRKNAKNDSSSIVRVSITGPHELDSDMIATQPRVSEKGEGAATTSLSCIEAIQLPM